MNRTEISMALVPVTTSVGTFTGLMPELSAIRRTKNDPNVARDVRTAEITAGFLVITVGVACSAMIDSPFPAIAAFLSVAALVVMYESVLAMNPAPTLKGHI